jgi:hypothetical protein
MALQNAPQYKSFGNEKLGVQISSGFNPDKHLESNSFTKLATPETMWLGIMNYIDTYENNVQPLISIADMKNSTVYIDGNSSSFLYGVPYKLGCPFVKEVLCEKSKLGFDNIPFHVVLSENLYTYNDILSTDRRHGKGLRVIPVQEAGEDAKIIPYNGGFRYLIGMASGVSTDYVQYSEIKPSTEIERVDTSGTDEFQDSSTSYTGSLLGSSDNRWGMDMFKFNIGVSDMSLSYYITADASNKSLSLTSTLPQLNGMPQEASTDIINFFRKEDVKGVGPSGNTSLKSVTSWIPKFMVNIAKELKDLQDTKFMYSPGWAMNNGRETVYGGQGIYHQIKRKGNHIYYRTAQQAFDLIKSMLSSLYSDKPFIAFKDRYIDVDLGDGIYELIQPMFQQYFNTDNKLIYTGDSTPFKDVLKKDKDGMLSYEPIAFGSVFYPNFGWINIKRNSSLTNLDGYKKTRRHVGKYPETAYMIVVKDVTANTFTGAKLEGVTVPKYAGNILYVKRKNVPDSMEYTLGGGYMSPQLLAAVGASANQSRDQSFKGIKLTFRTHGEPYVQDASRMLIAEFDPTGDLESMERGLAKAPLF